MRYYCNRPKTKFVEVPIINLDFAKATLVSFFGCYTGFVDFHGQRATYSRIRNLRKRARDEIFMNRADDRPKHVVLICDWLLKNKLYQFQFPEVL